MRVLLTGLVAALLLTSVSAQTDLDALMRQVLTRRDENWKKLQQYILDESESVELRGPSKTPIWGEHRDYTWYIRSGFFVRSPVKVNGAAVSESERRKLEAEYLKRLQDREKRGGQIAIGSSGLVVDPGDSEPADSDGILKQTRQPQFISMTYFLRFKFEQGKYALVGKESIDGRELLRIEYYPERLYSGTDRRRSNGRTSPDAQAYDAEFRRLMNKVALVTLWVEPASHQIVRYTFDNIALDFLPVQWLLHVDSITASMTMSQPFPDVWLPREVGIDAAMSVVSGQFYVHYGSEYHDYRQADVSTKIKIP
jgi:hypothetical protein